MGRIKALSLAGAAALIGVPTAQAADLLPPPPPIQAPLRGPVVESGFYIRADAGLANVNEYGLRSTFPGTTPAALGVTQETGELGDDGILGLGFGYKFNNWFRADLTGEYRSGVNYDSTVWYQGTGSCPAGGTTYCGDAYSGTVKTGLFLANGYLDMGTWYGFTPYIGGGVGFAAYQVSSFKDASLYPLGGFGTAPDHNGANFAWAVMAGVAYHIMPDLLLDVGYRYVNMGEISTGALSCSSTCVHETQHFNMEANDVRVGLRWMMAAPVYAAPVVAKY